MRVPDTDQPHRINGTRQELFVRLLEILPKVLHERVTKKLLNGYVVIYDTKNDKGKKMTVIQNEGTECPAMRELN